MPNACWRTYKGGGRLGFLWIRPKPVRRAKYLIRETYVDGRLCRTCESLEDLLESLRLEQKLELLWKDWSAFADRTRGSLVAEFHNLSGCCELLGHVLALQGPMAKTEEICGKTPGLPPPAWHIPENPDAYVRAIDAIEADRVLEKAVSPLNKAVRVTEDVIAGGNAHPIIENLCSAIRNRDTDAYSQAYEKIRDLAELKKAIGRWTSLSRKLAQAAEPVAEMLSTEPNVKEWDERCAHFEEGWQWARAKTWLREYVGTLTEGNLNSQLKRIETDIRTLTARLAAAKAWQYCMGRMMQEEEQHLKAWAQATRRVGKGTGKHAERHRRDARGHMEKCRSAIPAWIMPLYRVVETVKPGTDLFDVAIIDEASQSGPEALLLFFLAKRIVVVGDPEQISPQSIGVDRNQAVSLREQYIANIPMKDSVDPDTSFFALCNILFSGKIVLREHFRCMPEIIRFSNNLCYSTTPLKPLRQYARDRLEPIKTVYVPNGYRQGRTSRAANPPEAEALAATIEQCCKDPAYDGKSMGVVSLLGYNQARNIQRKLLEKIGAEEIEKRRLVCGDAYAFQGDERDVIFMSMVAARGETEMRAVVGSMYKQRFNVAASRARDQVWLFHTPTLNDFRNQECLRYQLLKYYLDYKAEPVDTDDIDVGQLSHAASLPRRRKSPPPYNFDSWFEVDVYLRIVGKGFRVRSQVEVAGYRIDLVVEGVSAQYMHQALHNFKSLQVSWREDTGQTSHSTGTTSYESVAPAHARRSCRRV